MSLYFEVTGEGRPIILVHCGGSDIRDWTYVVPILSKHYQVIAFDARGCGKSPSPTSPANYVEDLHVLLDHLQLTQPIIIGHSIGGRVATEFALTYPERVNKLILLGPELSGFTHSKEYSEMIQKTQAAAPDIDRMMELSLQSCSYRVVMASDERDLMVQMWRHNITRMMEWPTWESVWPCERAMDRLGDLAVKTCYMNGKKDAPDLLRIADYYQVVPDIRFVEIEDADHMPTLTHPEELCQHIIEFLGD